MKRDKEDGEGDGVTIYNMSDHLEYGQRLVDLMVASLESLGTLDALALEEFRAQLNMFAVMALDPVITDRVVMGFRTMEE